MANVLVGIVMGSKSDLPAMSAAGDVLDELGIDRDTQARLREAGILYEDSQPRTTS